MTLVAILFVWGMIDIFLGFSLISSPKMSRWKDVGGVFLIFIGGFIVSYGIALT